MTKVLVVTDGEYSDYRVEAVFSEDKRDLAEIYRQRYGGEIEEYELNPAEQQLREGWSHWLVRMDRDGNIPPHYEPSSSFTDESKSKVYIRNAHPSRELIGTFHVKAQSAEHAIKIANELRIQIVADNNWIDGNEWLKHD
ncbi:MAG: hypothetical protein ABIH23_14460 [bacterium]